MTLLRKEKEQLVSELSSELKTQPAVAILSFTSMSVEESTILRRHLRDMEGSMKVVKKRLLRFIAPAIGMKNIPSNIEGSVAVAWSEDLLAPAKALNEFVSEHKEVSQLVGGMLNGKELSADEVRALALLPSEEELKGKLVTVLAGPLRGFVSVLSGTLRGLPAVLQAHAQR